MKHAVAALALVVGGTVAGCELIVRIPDTDGPWQAIALLVWLAAITALSFLWAIWLYRG